MIIPVILDILIAFLIAFLYILVNINLARILLVSLNPKFISFPFARQKIGGARQLIDVTILPLQLWKIQLYIFWKVIVLIWGKRFVMIKTVEKIRVIYIWAATWQNQQSDCAPSEDSDQSEHPPSLIRVFAVRMKKAWVLSYPLSAQRRLWSDWEEGQADLSLRWAHSHFVGFVMSQLILISLLGVPFWR